LSEELKENIVQQDLGKLEGFLDDYEAKIGLVNITGSDVSSYLNLNQDSLRKLSPDDCAEGAFLLMKESLYVQHEINKYKAQLEWAKGRIERTIAGDLNNHGGRFATFETRQILAIKNNSYAQQLQQIVDRAQRIITRLSYLPNRLHDIANVLLDFRYTKTRSEKNETTRSS
jgi:hypothetical protein